MVSSLVYFQLWEPHPCVRVLSLDKGPSNIEGSVTHALCLTLDTLTLKACMYKFPELMVDFI